MSGGDKSRLEPRKNPELRGHGEAEKILAESLRSGRLPHAWLICGPEGIGKATLAFRFARYLLAGGPRAPSLFGAAETCSLAVDPDAPAFKRVASGGHADLMTVEIGINPDTGKRRTEIVVPDVRAVGEFLHMTPAEGGYRVVVVDAADDMNRHAANALLKILEEPPPQTVLLLVCHAPGRLPATVRSRCRKLVLHPLGDADVAALLARYLPEVPAEDRAVLVKLAEGSPGRALALAAEGGLEIYREMVALLAAPGNAQALQRFCEKSARGEEGFRIVGRLFLWWLARAIRQAAVGGGPEILPGEGAAMARISAGPGLDRTLSLWEKASRLFARAESLNLDRKQVMMSAFLELENTA